MKASRGNVGRAVDQPESKVRFYLLHGPDEAQSRALGERLVAALGASRYLIAASSVKSDPATLGDEAGAMSLFGGKRVIWIEPAGDEIVAGVEALLEANSVESPVVAIAGVLRKTSALLKLAESSPSALAFAAYLPEGADAERMVIDVGRRVGLKISPPVAARIADSAENDQAIVFQELQKLALYLDAAPESPKELDSEAIDAVGAELSEGDVPRLADLALAGEMAELADQLALLPHGAEGIPIVRALQRRLLQVAPARARIERGERPDAVMTSFGKSLFWKDKALVQRLLSLWDSRRLATISERAGKLEREMMFSPVPTQEALGEELLAIARAAKRR
ncbi:MAG TPA: DNA polymerase III subunit delta [Sphingomicrobium sp.]|jgi:DNA polymerase-3 subunit delta|nr:DNA polymerase III subunit delta [Sphingomicrobium sp.]